MLNIHEFIHNLDAYYKQVEKLAEKIQAAYWLLGSTRPKTMDILELRVVLYRCRRISGAVDSDMTPKICCHIVKDIYDNIYHLKIK